MTPHKKIDQYLGEEVQDYKSVHQILFFLKRCCYSDF